MYYIIGSEDILHRSAPVENADDDETIVVEEDPRAKQWQQWLSNQGNDDLSKDTRNLLS